MADQMVSRTDVNQIIRSHHRNCGAVALYCVDVWNIASRQSFPDRRDVWTVTPYRGPRTTWRCLFDPNPRTDAEVPATTTVANLEYFTGNCVALRQR